MNLLLDTHAFIWWVNEPEKLSAKVLELCDAEENVLYLSVASIWEIELKIHSGKLKFDEPIQTLVKSEMADNDLKIVPIPMEHVFGVNNLPPVHKDPFDRLLIAQAIFMGASLVSIDKLINAYPVPVIW